MPAVRTCASALRAPAARLRAAISASWRSVVPVRAMYALACKRRGGGRVETDRGVIVRIELQVEDAIRLALGELAVRRDQRGVTVAGLHADPGVVGAEGGIHLEVQVLPRRPRAHDVERRDEAEGPAVHVVGGAGDLIVDGVALDAAVGERLAHDGVEHLGGHAVLVAGDDRQLREADDGDVA